MAHATVDDFFAELAGAAARHDAVPASVLTGARSAFRFQRAVADLASLVYDSDLDDELLVGVRATGAPRVLTFEATADRLELSMQDGGRAVGQLVPPGPARVEVHTPDGSTVTEADDLGRFRVRSVPAGPVSIEWARSGTAPPVATDWITV